MVTVTLILALSVALLRTSDALAVWAFPFNDPSLPWEQRVDDLVGRLTVEEITQQMAQGGRTTHAPAIPRLGIPPYSWGVECLRGDIKAGPATSFPQALGLAASFSHDVLFDVSRATGLEVRAKFNNYSSHGYYGMHSGASCWSPVINIMRDPRWGRNQETYGEDPYMSGELAKAFVRGLQGDDDRYLLTNAGCKHFDAYGGPENIPISRHKFNAKVTEADLRMTFFPAFKSCVEAGAYSFMCSYNSVNGIPACANRYLLTDILRSEWGFRGYVISDESAIEDIMLNHKYTTSIPDTAAAAVNAGTNLEDGPHGTAPFFLGITEAVQSGKLEEKTVREAVKPLFLTRMRLGLFDPPQRNPYSRLSVHDVVQSASHRRLAITSAMKTFVLLKNTGAFLPLDGSTFFNELAIVGPMANNTKGIFGGYAPDPTPKYVRTPLESLSSLGKAVSYHPGCLESDTACEHYDPDGIQKAVHGTDLVIVCLGTGDNIESESNDRSDILLPGKQLQLLQDAIKFSGQDDTGPAVILLLFNAGPLDISWAIFSPRIRAILECFFPAQATGTAVRKVLLNDGPGANPAGRLPATWPVSANQYPPITDYKMVNRTYRYFSAEPLFPFGYGLSYTRFIYMDLVVTPSVVHAANVSKFTVEATLKNIGHLDGEEVVQAYMSWPTPIHPGTPKLQLVAFDRMTVEAGQASKVRFTVRLEQIAIWKGKERFVTPKGTYEVYFGGQQPNQKVNVGSNVLKTTITIG